MSVKQLLLPAALTLLSLAPAASAATVDFATLGGNNGDNFTTYTENGFTVANGSGQFFVGQAYGNPLPSIFAGPNYGPAADSVTITKVGGGSFSLTQFDLGSNNGSTSYDAIGSFNGSPAYSIVGTDSSAGTFVTIAGSPTVVNSVTLQFTAIGGTTSFNLDNIVLTPSVAPVPEPSSLALIGTGLVGVATAVRRRKA